MEITFLFGNGLDLNCGCKSSYSDIYKKYVESSTDNQTPLHHEWIKRLKKGISNWGDFEMEMAKYVSTCKSEEEAIACIRDFNKFMRWYLSSENARMVETLSKNGGIMSEITNSIRRFYTNNTPNVTKTINRYLQNTTLYYNFISFNYTTFLDTQLLRAAKDISDKTNQAISGGMYLRDPWLIHIHGKLGEDEIVGVDNYKQFGAIPYENKSLERVFVKPHLNKLVDSYRVDDAVHAIEHSDVICVYGMSLGDSDLTWRSKIIDWVGINEDHHLFLYDYSHCKQRGSLLIDEKIEMEENAVSSFLEKCNTQNHSIRNRIHIPIGTNIFNIGSVVEKEHQLELEKAKVKTKILTGLQSG